MPKTEGLPNNELLPNSGCWALDAKLLEVEPNIDLLPSATAAFIPCPNNGADAPWPKILD